MTFEAARATLNAGLSHFRLRRAETLVPMVAETARAPDPVGSVAAANADASALAAAGSPNDPRMKEAMRLMKSFLAIEDAAGRAALITLAERLVNYDWVRKAGQG
jgi:hypothetical protein